MRHLRKKKVRQRSLKHYPRAGQVQLGQCLDGGGGVWQHWQRVRLRDYSPGIFPLIPLSLLLCLALYASVLALDHFWATWSSWFFQGCASCIKPDFCGGRQNACRLVASKRWSLWWSDQRLRACITILWGAMTWPDLSTSACSPPSKRHRWVHTAMVSCPTAQEAKVPPSVPQPLGYDLPTKIIPLHINIRGPHWVYHWEVKGCPEGPSPYHAAICSIMHHVHLGMKLTCSFCPTMFFNTNAIGGMASGHITLGLQTPLKKSYTSTQKREFNNYVTYISYVMVRKRMLLKSLSSQ